MARDSRYPKIFIRSKNDFAKHISHKGFSKSQALELINLVMKNFGGLWHDNKKQSEPEKNKYVRSAKGTKLGVLLKKINELVLAPGDKLLPRFIFGGVSKLNHVRAAKHLLGHKRRRVLLKMDISRFFEQVAWERVYGFFRYKAGCDHRASKILADLCCVPVGSKDRGDTRRTIARGFATSSRLAVWCNLNIFIALDQLVQNRLKGRDPRLAIYVDDIGVTATHITKAEMDELRKEIEQLMETFDPHQPLSLNKKKTKIISHEENPEHLGLRLNRNSLSLGSKTRSKRDSMLKKSKGELQPSDKVKVREKYKSIKRYERYVKSV